MPSGFGDRAGAPIPLSTFKAAAVAAGAVAGVVGVGALMTLEGKTPERVALALAMSAGTFIATFIMVLFDLALMHARTSVMKSDWAAGHDGMLGDSKTVRRDWKVHSKDDAPPPG